MVQLQISMRIANENWAEAAAIYNMFKRPFLEGIPGAISNVLLVRGEDVQVQHGFDTREHAEDYLKSDLFNKDVAAALWPLMQDAADIRIYDIV